MRLHSTRIRLLIGIIALTEIEVLITIETSNGIEKRVGIEARIKIFTLNGIECQNQYFFLR